MALGCTPNPDRRRGGPLSFRAGASAAMICLCLLFVSIFTPPTTRAAWVLPNWKPGDLTGAIANLQAALAGHPDDPELLSQLARAAGVLSGEAKDTEGVRRPQGCREIARAGKLRGREGCRPFSFRRSLPCHASCNPLPGCVQYLGASSNRRSCSEKGKTE